MSSKNLEYIKKYFLSFDKKEQESIYASLTDEQMNLLIEIGQAFHSNKGVSILANNILVGGYLRELEDIQIEYFIGLSELLAEGKSNEIIEKLQSNKNPLFDNIVSEFIDNISFENDLLAGLTNNEREEIKSDLSIIDGAEEILDAELQKAIIHIERNELKNKLRGIEFEIAKVPVVISKSSMLASTNPIQPNKNPPFVDNENLSKYNLLASRFPLKRYLFYSIAACFSLCIIGISTYLLMDKQQIKYAKPADINSTKDIVLLDTSIISGEKRIKIPIFYFTERIDSVIIQIKNIDIIIDEIKGGLDTSFSRKNLGYSKLYKLDSLLATKNTYSFTNSVLILNLDYFPKETKLFSNENVKDDMLILKLDYQYFEIMNNQRNKNLVPLTKNQLNKVPRIKIIDGFKK